MLRSIESPAEQRFLALGISQYPYAELPRWSFNENWIDREVLELKIYRTLKDFLEREDIPSIEEFCRICHIYLAEGEKILEAGDSGRQNFFAQYRVHEIRAMRRLYQTVAPLLLNVPNPRKQKKDFVKRIRGYIRAQEEDPLLILPRDGRHHS